MNDFLLEKASITARAISNVLNVGNFWYRCIRCPLCYIRANKIPTILYEGYI